MSHLWHVAPLLQPIKSHDFIDKKFFFAFSDLAFFYYELCSLAALYKYKIWLLTFCVKKTFQAITKLPAQSDLLYQPFVSIRSQHLPFNFIPSITDWCWMPYQDRLSFLKILTSSQRARKEKRGKIKTKTKTKRQSIKGPRTSLI